jgi:hypothetical protein
MMQADTPPGTDLTAQLRRVRARWVRLTALSVLARAATAGAIVLALASAAERMLRMSDGAVLLLAAATAAAAAGVAIAIAWPLRRRPDTRRVARFVEERCPECADAIVTAVDLTERGAAGRDFAPLVVASAVRTLASLDLDRVLDRRDVRRAAWRAAGSGIVVALAIAIAAPFLDRAAQVAYTRVFPASLTLTVVPGDMRIAAGKPATILATVKGRALSLDRLAAQITLDAGGRPVTLPMERTAEGYRFQIPSVERSFRYLVSAGPAASRAYSVTALHPSRVQRIDLQYDFPSFTGLAPRLDRDSGDVFGPAGTRVRVLVHADKPIRGGSLAFSQGQPSAPLVRVDDRTFAASLTIAQESAYRVGLVDPDGLTSESVEYFVRVMDDRPPDVHILRPGGDEGITPLQEVPIEARADDDFGIETLDLVYSVAGGPEHTVPFTSFTGTELARIGARMLAAEDLKVKPGDVIAYYARAWDVPRAKRSTMARSEIFFLEVKPFNEEYTLAQSQAGMQAATATQLDGLISAQKEIISATWNLERRATAGTSSTDVKGIADAQTELKGRAERAAGSQPQRRRFGQGPMEQVTSPPQPSSNADPVLQAVEAMGRAATELQNQKTAGAIPHEMAALNALLQAQAEIRKRQVAQQQQGNGGGAWGNRQTQDLSTLFDRELKRQQKTNYENKAEVETQPEAQKTESALDKIRDLARRQEELTRQQRELAKGGLSADEMKRRLETLTREQEQLRRQLEDASRQMQQQSAQGSQGTSPDARAKGDAQQDVKDALQQMRDSAAQGQRDDASGAASKSEQAADALRRAESRMENGSPDAQKRALGDLQLESQQVAKEQQRIADEAERLDREGGGTGDARRRLAGEKERLADRVDAMQQSARRLPAASDAAKDLAGQQIGSRMRSTAQQLRDGQPGARSAQAERQIADALDRIARKMGSPDAGGAKGEAKAGTTQLAGDLDEVRDARDRVARLQREMREAQQQRARGQNANTPGSGAPRGAESTQGQRSAEGNGQGGDVARIQQQLNEELQRTRDLLDRVQRANQDSGGRMATPEQHEWSRSAPGTEAFKQDYAAWQSLAADVTRALERAESSAASRLSAALARDRLRAGGSERVPDAYRRQVSRYFESIAVKKQP